MLQKAMSPRHVIPIVALASAIHVHGATVTAPYFTNFDGPEFTVGDNTGTFSEAQSTAGNGTTTGTIHEPVAFSGDYVLRHVVSATGQPASGTPPTVPSNNANKSSAVTNADLTFSGAGGFIVSTTFVVESYMVSGGTVNISIVGASNNLNFSSGTSYRLTYTVGSSGTGQSATGAIALTEFGGGTLGTVSYVGTTITPQTGVEYTLTLQGTYNSASNITLFGSISNSSSTLTASVTDSSALAGSNFGMRTAIAANTTTTSATTETVNYTSFSLEAIPEPTSVMLTLIGVSFASSRRRR